VDILSAVSGYFKAGGPFMFIILGTGVVTLAILLERVWVIGRASSLNHGRFGADLERLVKGGDLNGAVALCRRVNSPVSKVAYHIFGEAGGGIRDLQAAAESGAVLDADQMVALAGLLESRRATIRGADAQGPGRHGRGSRGPGGPGAHGLGIGAHFAARQLDADPETVRALHEALRSQHETLRPLWDGYLEGAVSAEALRDGLRAARENVEGSAETLLDADQRGKLDGFVAEMRERAAEQQLERLDDRLERHADLLVKALDLDETRAAAVRGVLDRAGTEWRGTIEAGGSGSIQIEESVYRTLTLLASTKDAIRAELTEDQARVFDAFAELMPR